ncbi:transglutaminase-like cysteine peptidase [Vibrio sp. EA2]|uniref:transglutaminase-like cysteine peptidase n=1 Tax=Vibrio sp. EA2 TaxID=3079860 RepID=UPI002949B13E|nr:transglutaminase-like cysteine peptidase [Vibrio sp. EA2]MDV6251900.1 transglutaminase-like cysteine peptidase [Vibrio sp. EA2]
MQPIFKSKVTLLISISCLSLQTGALNTEEQRWVDKVTAVYGQRAGVRVSTWRNTLTELSNADTHEKLAGVNRFFNQLYFVDDNKLWGRTDYWATPLEFLGSNAGDCEDFTIAKYFSLLELGVPDSKMRLVYVKAIELNQFHMVLAYYPTASAEPLILDNINGEIVRASHRRDLLPIYSFNGTNLWLIKSSAGSGELAGKASRLSLWNDLRSRERKLQLKKPKINYDE